MKCKYRVRWFHSKGASLTLFWIGNLVVVAVSILELLPPIRQVTDEKFYWVYSFFVVIAVLAGPLTGWLADAKFGNYKIATTCSIK